MIRTIRTPRTARHAEAAHGARTNPLTVAAALGAVALVGGAVAFTTTVREAHAGFHDTTTAVVEVSGAFDLGVSDPALGTPAVEQGDPDPIVVGVTGSPTFSTTTPVEWRATVHATAAAGRATLTLFDPEDEPVVLAGETHPDLFSTLRFTVVDVTDPAAPRTLVADAPATEVNAAALTLDLAAGGSRTVAVQAVVADGTWRIYDGRSTSMGLRFSGESS